MVEKTQPAAAEVDVAASGTGEMATATYDYAGDSNENEASFKAGDQVGLS